MSVCYFGIYHLGRRARTFILTNLSPSFSMKMLKFTDRYDRRTDRRSLDTQMDRRQTTGDQKSSLELSSQNAAASRNN